MANTEVKSLQEHAYYKIHNHEVVEDLVQSTFLKTWKFLLDGGKVETMRAFLYHILNNLIIDEYRKRKTASLDLLLEKGFEPYIDNKEKILKTMEGERAIAMIKRLPKKYKRVMEMKYIQELSLVEISRATKQTKNAVAVQTYRGLEKLKQIYFGQNTGIK